MSKAYVPLAGAVAMALVQVKDKTNIARCSTAKPDVLVEPGNGSPVGARGL
jgi:hypothetical protein